MIKKVIYPNHTLIKNINYPKRFKAKGLKKSMLGIGGNLGDVVRRFNHLFYYLNKSPMLTILETSPIVKNPPFGYIEQDYFYNALVLVETKLTPRELLDYLLRVERLFGRKRLFKDGPRTLDIDIIFYENVKMDTTVLTIPHHGWKDRTSVLIPLSHMKGRL